MLLYMYMHYHAHVITCIILIYYTYIKHINFAGTYTIGFESDFVLNQTSHHCYHTAGVTHKNSPVGCLKMNHLFGQLIKIVIGSFYTCSMTNTDLILCCVYFIQCLLKQVVSQSYDQQYSLFCVDIALPACIDVSRTC